VLLFISALVFPLIRYLLQRRFTVLPPLRGREWGARWLAIAVAVLNLGALAGLAVAIGGVSEVLKGEIDGIGYVLLLPILASILTLGLVWFTITAWRKGMWGGWGRVHYTLFTIGALTFTWVLNHWNLLGWHL
jgi:hypothetical protein